jgi:putative SOS response-associated peptidase YedK
VVPASGFFEWKGEPGHKQPFAITAADQPLFALAGLWESWHDRVQDWLTAPPATAQALLTPYAGPVSIRAISKLVGNPRNDVPEVLADA